MTPARTLVLAVATAYLATAAVGRAQNATLDSYFKIWSTARAQINLRKQAACAVRKYPDDARQVVVDDLSMLDILSRVPHLTKPCGDGALFRENTFSISQPVLEIVLAEALIARPPEGTPLEAVSTAPPQAREAPPQDLSALPPKKRDAAEFAAMLRRLDVAADCAVRRDPAGAATLARSQPYSDAERSSFQRLDASLRACDPSPVGAPEFILRGVIAYELYRLLDAAHGPGGAKESTGA